MKQNPNIKNKGLIIIEDKPLTKVETRRLSALEAAIQENFLGFVIVGLSLAEINEQRLYRTKEERTFNDYCLEIWHINADRAYKLIRAALVIQNVENFLHSETQDVDIIAPKNEAQAKELLKLPPEDQGPVWIEFVEQASKKDTKLTAKNLKKSVCEHRGEKLPKILKENSEDPTETDHGKPHMSENFKKAWEALWEQVEIERQSNWRYTSKSVVYERTSILLEAIAESGIKRQPEREAE